MPSQPSSTSTETVRLADVFVRLPNDHHRQQNGKPTAPQGQKMDSSEVNNVIMPHFSFRFGQSAHSPAIVQNISATAQHRPPTAPKEPLTPQKKTPNAFEAIQVPRLPPTPDATPTKKNHLKRCPQTAILDPQSPSSSSSSIKRARRTHHLNPIPSPSPHRRFLRTPKFSIVYQPERPREGEEEEAMSWMELKRVAESVMKQVDWEEVAQDVASNRSASMYKRIVRDVLQERIEELVWREEERK